jgi:hypothetical protein
MHYNVLILLLFSLPLKAIPYDPLYTPIYPPFGYNLAYTVEGDEPEEDLEKDRSVYHSRYDNEYTALPDKGEEPDYYTIDCPPINPYENIEIIIIENDD